MAESKTEFREGMRTKEIPEGVAKVVRLGEAAGEECYFILGVRDKGTSQPVYLPVFEGDLSKVRELGFRLEEGEILTGEERQRLVSALQVLPPLLAVQAVLGEGESDYGVYQNPEDRIPSPILGMEGNPGAGKTSFLTTIAVAEGDRVVKVRDFDPFSPENVTDITRRVKEKISGKKLSLELILGSIEECYNEDKLLPRERIVLPLAKLISDLKREYRKDSDSLRGVVDEGEVRKCYFLIDLPGVKRDLQGRIAESGRKTDAYDLVGLGVRKVQMLRLFEDEQGRIEDSLGVPMTPGMLAKYLTAFNQQIEWAMEQYEDNLRGLIVTAAGGMEIARGEGERPNLGSDEDLRDFYVALYSEFAGFVTELTWDGEKITEKE
jgi:hypothetical protein